MNSLRRLRAGLVLALAGLGGAAQAQSVIQSSDDIIDEVRIGLHAHAASDYFWPYHVGEWDMTEIGDVSFDVLFTSPRIDVFRWIGAPRPEIGVTANLMGDESLLHAGLTWQLPIFDTGLYLEGSLGGAIHTGYLTDAPRDGRNLGCRVNFYERFGAGINVTENLTATLTYEHTSNWEMCEDNDGLSNIGLRVGWKF